MFAKPRHTRSGISDTLAFLEQVYFGTVRGMRKSSGRNAVLGLIGIHDADGRFYYGLLFYVSAVGGSDRRRSRAIICSILFLASQCS